MNRKRALGDHPGVRERLAILLLGLTCACAAAFGEYEVAAEQLGGTTLDAEQATLRYAVRACYVGAGDPQVEIELSPWIDSGEGEVEAVFEADLDAAYALSDKRSPVAPLHASLAASTACETGVVVRFTLAKPGAGKTATLAWVVVGRALGDDPSVAEGEMLVLDGRLVRLAPELRIDCQERLHLQLGLLRFE